MNDSIEGPRRSKLTFVASCDRTARVEVGQLRRVRKPVSRSKSGVQGKVADVPSGRSRHQESQNELRAFQILLASQHADAWQEQPSFSNTTMMAKGTVILPTFSSLGAPIGK